MRTKGISSIQNLHLSKLGLCRKLEMVEPYTFKNMLTTAQDGMLMIPTLSEITDQNFHATEFIMAGYKAPPIALRP